MVSNEICTLIHFRYFGVVLTSVLSDILYIYEVLGVDIGNQQYENHGHVCKYETTHTGWQ